MINKIKISLVFLFIFFITNTFSQKKLDPWIKLLKDNNCIVSFIFYSKADNYNNGIVIKIENKNKFTIRYRFTIIAKIETVEKEKIFKGELTAVEIRTGSNNNLFWIPELKGKSITEIGIKKWKFYKPKYK